MSSSVVSSNDSFALPGYQIHDEIFAGRSTRVLRAQRLSDERPVIVKTLVDYEFPGMHEIEKLRREFAIASTPGLRRVVRPLEIAEYGNGIALVFEDHGGDSLAKIIREKNIGIAAFLRIAIRIVDALESVHSAGIIHLDIKPHNIVVNAQTGDVALTDFGIATRLSRENPTVASPERLQGTLAYMSPEQTGRMNRSIDYRADLYSLGVTFYEMLTRTLPFSSDDPLAMIHFHIAVIPESPRVRSPEIPQPISEIVMKLMARNAEDRYQSARGLRHDLEECLRRAKQNGAIESFAIGTRDVSGRFQIPQKLYGRERELDVLMRNFHGMADGASRLLLIGGFSGIGKTALVNEVHKPIVQHQGYFVGGKFDQFRRDLPYSAVLQSFQELIRQILTESESRLAYWKSQLAEALGDNGRVIADVLPELELLIGSPPPVPELGPTESENRFQLVFKRFLRSFARREHPLVIFLDDLQWADLPSLRLLQNVLTDPGVQHLFVIAAYRDNEVDATHPLMVTLGELTDAAVAYETIVLQAIDELDARELIADTVGIGADETKIYDLARIVYDKTGGNPFFLQEFLKELYTDGLILFDAANLRWNWDSESIRSRDLTDNVIDLMTAKIRRLSPENQRVLQLASCIGNEFDLRSLAIVCEQTEAELLTSIEPVLKEGFVLPIGENYKFVVARSQVRFRFLHDRVQQAANAMIPDEERARVHLSIARHLRASAEREEALFTLVNHFGQAAGLLDDPVERREVAELNFAAGKKALLSTAYEAGTRYLEAGLALLPEDRWVVEYEHTLHATTQLASAWNLRGEFERSEQLVHEVLQNARDVLDRVPAYDVRIRTLNNQVRLPESLQAAREILKQLGVYLPERGSFLKTGPVLARAKAIIALRGAEYVLRAKPMTDARMLAAMAILRNIGSTAYQTDFWLFGYIVMVMVYLTYRSGNSPDSPFGLGLYGVALLGVLGDISGGYRFGRLSLKLLERLNARNVACKTIMTFNTFVRHWKEPARNAWEDHLKGAQVGFEPGDIEFAGYNHIFRMMNRLYSHSSLPEVREDFLDRFRELRRYGQDQVVYASSPYVHILHSLMDPAFRGDSFNSEYFNETQHLEYCHSVHYQSGLDCYHQAKAHILYLFGDYEQSIHYSAQTTEAIMGMPLNGAMYMMDSLACLALARDAKFMRRWKLLWRARKHRQLLRKWARHAPENQAHRVKLVEAEFARTRGRVKKAARMYDEAFRAARVANFLMDEALCQELAGEFYHAGGDLIRARKLLGGATYAYIRWGSPAKANQIKRRYHELLETNTNRSGPVASGSTTQTAESTTGMTATTGTAPQTLDLSTVIKATEALSGEIFLDQLLRKTMQLVLENAGAERGCLMLERDGVLYIEAEGESAAPEQTRVMHSLAVDTDDVVPLSIVQYVNRTGENVVLGDATREGLFTASPYVMARRPASVLCGPITKQGRRFGILYLENRVAAHAFTTERLELLRILTTQAAVALENARLVAEETERQKLQKEMEMARNIQLSILPSQLEDNLYDIAAHMTPAEQVGGDYYDYYLVGADRWLAIGDVTGHGMNSGLLMMMAQTSMSAYLKSVATPTVKGLYQSVNSTLHENLADRTRQDLYMTFTALRADAAGNFTHVGRHEDILVRRAATGQVEVIPSDGVWVGIVPDVSAVAEELHFRLEPGDIVVLFTDGVIECRNAAGEQFDLPRLIQLIEEHKDADVGALRDRIVKACFDFMDRQADDVTLFLMQRRA